MRMKGRKKKILSAVLALCMALMMMPFLPLGGLKEVKAAEADATRLDVARGSVTINSDSITITRYDEEGKLVELVEATDPDGYYLYSSGKTGNTVTINCNTTIYLGGLNIEVAKPTSVNDYSKPNPININGSYEVTLVLVDGETNTLASEEGRPFTNRTDVSCGSGRAALRVPTGASLTIEGKTGTLNATGAQGHNLSDKVAHGGGGAGIGGDGGYAIKERNAEGSGSITINGGNIIATGGDDMGYWGAGGAGIGGGGGKYNSPGGSSSPITINGGSVTVKAGQELTFTPIGAGGSGGTNMHYTVSRASTGQIEVNDGTLILETAIDDALYKNMIIGSGAKIQLADGTNQYVIHYKLNGGTNNESNPALYTAGEGVTTLNDPVWDGHVFRGWYTDSGFTGDAITSIATDKAENITLYAKWDQIIPVTDVTVTYDGNDHAITGTDQDHYRVSGNTEAINAGTYIYKVTPNTGYCWGNGSTSEKDITVTIDKAKLTATYTGDNITFGQAPAYTVEVTGFVNGEDASTAEDYSAPTITDTDKPDLSKNQTLFRELKPSGGSAKNYDFTCVSGTLHMNERLYLIRFDSNGGNTDEVEKSTNTAFTLDSLPDASRTGYTFAGWYTAKTGGDKITSDTIFGGDTTVYAHWTAMQASSSTNYVVKPSDEPTTPTTYSVKFADVGSEDYFYEAVMWALENNVTSGTSDTTFSPHASCTRAQMITFLWRASGSPKAEGTDDRFEDVSENAFYYDAVQWALEKGITSGTTDTTFSPNDPVTRAQAAVFLHHANGAPEISSSASFDDISEEMWYADAVAWMAENELTNGTTENTYSPHASCTRAQIVTFLHRAQG